jgi:hypothetical protein
LSPAEVGIVKQRLEARANPDFAEAAGGQWRTAFHISS